jgi:hypothetical protein
LFDEVTVEHFIETQQEEDCKGRIGLHSLPLTEHFYGKVCRMTPAGRDPAKQNLVWFEYTPEQAAGFLNGEGL